LEQKSGGVYLNAALTLRIEEKHWMYEPLAHPSLALSPSALSQ
jgi:hypothetical protein